MDFERYSETFLHFHRNDIPSLIMRYFKQEMLHIVDLGAGDGAILAGMKYKGLLKSNNKVIAVDLSTQRCERLADFENFKVICGDVTNVPELPSKHFDFVICTQVIEHVDQIKLMREIHRIIRPYGKLYIASLIKKKYGFWYYKTKEGKWGIDPTHLREYTSICEFEGVIKAGGFKVIETRTSALKLSVLEFLMRRIIVPIFKPNDVNKIFLRYKFFDYLRKKINIVPPGYQIVETIAEARNDACSP